MPSKLASVDPALVEKVQRILAAMELLGFPMLVTDGRRTVIEQQILYAQGRTNPGKIVTYADGVVNKSKHQLGHAVDCCFLKDGVPSWDPSHPWALYGAMAQALGLIWGGAWINFKDRTHVEVR